MYKRKDSSGRESNLQSIFARGPIKRTKKFENYRDVKTKRHIEPTDMTPS